MTATVPSNGDSEFADFEVSFKLPNCLINYPFVDVSLRQEEYFVSDTTVLTPDFLYSVSDACNIVFTVDPADLSLMPITFDSTDGSLTVFTDNRQLEGQTYNLAVTVTTEALEDNTATVNFEITIITNCGRDFAV